VANKQKSGRRETIREIPISPIPIEETGFVRRRKEDMMDES